MTQRWERIDILTSAMEIPGVGCLVRSESPERLDVTALVFVPGARIKNGALVREDRANPLASSFTPPTPEELRRARAGVDADGNLDDTMDSD